MPCSRPRGGDLDDLPPQLPAEPAQVMADQHRQVVAPLPQRGQVDRVAADAVVEIRAVLPHVRPLLQVAVGRGDRPHVGPDGLAAADPHELLLLQDPQDLGLRPQGHVADLVQEERAAIALLELADPPAVGPGEGAPLVAEQLALEEVLRDRGAVQRQEGRARPRAVLRDGPCHPTPLSAFFSFAEHLMPSQRLMQPHP